MKTDYTPLYANDFLIYAQILTSDEIKTVLTIVSEVALFGKSKTDPSELSAEAIGYLHGLLEKQEKSVKIREARKAARNKRNETDD